MNKARYNGNPIRLGAFHGWAFAKAPPSPTDEKKARMGRASQAFGEIACNTTCW
jgi:hypothetical protein